MLLALASSSPFFYPNPNLLFFPNKAFFMSDTSSRAKPAWKRYLPLAVLLSVLAAFFVLRSTGHLDFLSLDALKDNQAKLHAWVDNNFLTVYAAYFAIYVLVAACSLPFALLMSLTGGFLFGVVWGGVAIIFAATLGATAVFLATRSAFGDFFLQRAGNKIKKLEQGFQKDVVNYMLFLRFVPVFPFFLINIAAAVFRVPLRVFFLTTLFGVAPGSFIFALSGSSLNDIFAAGQNFSPETILTPKVIGALVGLSLLSLLPILYRKLKKSS